MQGHVLFQCQGRLRTANARVERTTKLHNVVLCRGQLILKHQHCPDGRDAASMWQLEILNCAVFLKFID